MHIPNLRACFSGLAALALLSALPCRATYLDPGSFTSLGTLNISNSDNYVFNTSTDTLTDTTTASVLYTGVTSNGIAVFDFSSVDLSGGTFTVTGSDPLALLSQTDLTITGSASLSANGGNAGSPTGGIGVGGGGNGGNGRSTAGSGSNGVGPGASPGEGCGTGGAGFGGAGGASECPSPGGTTYGNLISQLVGGSGAGGAGDGDNGGGGAGGGAIELGAATIGGILTISAGGTVSANGGEGATAAGGGSGGGLFLHAATVSLSGADALSVAGGNNGGDGPNGGGGGGAGQIAIETNNYTNTGTFDTLGGEGYIKGGNFTFTGPVAFPTPEPSTFALSAAIFAAFAVFRRRSSF